jgi:16S rRNA G966 N2-methylase RsmD
MNELTNIFNYCTISDNFIFPPKREEIDIAPKLYVDFKKILVQNLGKWKAGKIQAFEFPFDPSSLLEKLRNGERPNYKQEWHYFPTPDVIIDEMLNTCIPFGELNCLEPSAGRGAIIERINWGAGSMANISWDAIEAEPTNREVLQNKGINLIWDDFDTFVTDKKYDIIYANPPFKKDFQHVEKMLDLLDKNGCAVIVLPNNFESKYKKHIEKWEEDFEHIGFRQMDKGSFKSSGTMVETVIMYASFKG